MAMDALGSKEEKEIYVCFLCGNLMTIQKGHDAPKCDCEEE